MRSQLLVRATGPERESVFLSEENNLIVVGATTPNLVLQLYGTNDAVDKAYVRFPLLHICSNLAIKGISQSTVCARVFRSSRLFSTLLLEK
jgi:hypothetical protein